MGSDGAKGDLARSDSSNGAFGRRRWLWCAALSCALFCVALLGSSSASALIHRGHVFGSTFEGTGEHSFSTPTGIAVNESTGEVYVADPGKERVERFSPDGKGGYEFASEFSVPGVEGIAIDNATGSPSHGDVYAVGVNKPPKKGEEPETEHNFLYKFTSTGEKLFKDQIFKTKEKNMEGESEEYEVEFEEIHGVAVDATGKLWVTWGLEGSIAGFTNGTPHNKLIGLTYKEEALTTEQPPQFEPQLGCPAKPGFAVAPDDEYFYLAHEHENGFEECLEQATTPVVVAKLKNKNAGTAFPANAGAAVASELTLANTRGVAVDAANGDAYVNNITSVAAFSSGGALIQRFGSGQLSAGSAIAVNSEAGAFAPTRGDVFVADGSKIVVFVPESESGAPTVDSVFAQNLTPSSTRLSAQIDPRGSDTHYFFQYGTTNCAVTPSACTNVPAAPGADLGSGFGDQTAEVVLEGLQPDTTYYYRVIAENEHGKGESSLTASSFFVTLPSAEGLLADQRQWEMVSPPTKGGVLEAMTNQGPAAIQAAEDGSGLTYDRAISGPLGEPEGNRSIAVTQFLFNRGESEWSGQDITTPHNKGEWFKPGGQLPEYRLFSPNLALSIVEPEAQLIFPIESLPLSPLLEGEKQREKTIYLRNNPPFSPSAGEKQVYDEAVANREYLAPGYLPLVTEINATAKNPFGLAMGKEGNGFLGATPDLNHVVLSSEVPLTTGAVGEGLYEWNSEAPSHALQLVSVLPGGQPAPSPRLGGHAIARNAISNDGSHVVFTSADPSGFNEAASLFVRNTATSQTVQANAVQGEHTKEPTAEELEEEPITEVHFEAASKDGSKVFFEDTWPLTDTSSLDPSAGNARNPSDLYEFNVGSGKLTDLTPAQKAGESADVLGAIPGASADGSYVYFVANGALTPDAKPGDCPGEPPSGGPPPVGLSCNLYVSEPDAKQPDGRRTRLIARLSATDAADWGQGVNASAQGTKEAGDLLYVSSRVSPNGRYLAFMSERSLTGYNNEDVTSKAPGERLDEEVYLYDATAGRLVCASCNPSGERPAGVFDTPQAGEGNGLLVDRSRLWENRWLAASVPGWTPASVTSAIYQSRYLSDSGRLFFNSADALVSADKNHKDDVYEYEQQGTGSCTNANSAGGCVSLISSGSEADEHESAFLDASASGNDVYFLTTSRLLAQDYDTSFDIYDAHVCGTSEGPACLPTKLPPSPPCTGEGCKSAAPGGPTFSSSATATFSGPGNTAANGVLPNKTKVTAKSPTRAQKLAKALKACKKLKKKKKRVACEKQARKKYGAKKKATKKSSAKKSSSHGGRRR